jgi:hypothetical protein
MARQACTQWTDADIAALLHKTVKLIMHRKKVSQDMALLLVGPVLDATHLKAAELVGGGHKIVEVKPGEHLESCPKCSEMYGPTQDEMICTKCGHAWDSV